MRWRAAWIVSARDTPLSYGPLHDTVNWLSERDIGRDGATPGWQGVGGPGSLGELNPSGPAERTGHEDAESVAVPDGHPRRGSEQSTQIEGEENEAAAARPRHDQTNGRARRLEPDAQRLYRTSERDQAGKREG